jgi:hypothetical protein
MFNWNLIRLITNIFGDKATKALVKALQAYATSGDLDQQLHDLPQGATADLALPDELQIEWAGRSGSHFKVAGIKVVCVKRVVPTPPAPPAPPVPPAPPKPAPAA